MGSYLDTSWADLRALTRQRRAEAAARRPVVRFTVRQSVEFEAVTVAVSTSLLRNRRRAKAWRKQQWALGVRACCYCRCELTVAPDRLNSATTEHRDPLSRGGADAPSNWAVSCLACNRAKGELTEAEFLALWASD